MNFLLGLDIVIVNHLKFLPGIIFYMKKRALRSVLIDGAIMNEFTGNRTTLEAARSSAGNESLDVLLGGDDTGICEGAYTQTEAIILLYGRPALLVQDGQWEKPDSQEIQARLASAKSGIEKAIPKVGRVEILNFSSDYVGTGWMIAEDVLITNRHVARLFGERRANLFYFRTNAEGGAYEVQVDFRKEHQRTAISPAAIKEISYIEEDDELRPDMALVRLDQSGGALPAPVELDDELVVFNPHEPAELAVIGYPAEDPRNDAFAMRDIFRNIYKVKRLSPGRLLGVRSDGKLLEHDCTTLGGNSGSLVLNLATGRACGLHFSGTYRESNYAVTSSWLKSRLREIEPRQVSVPTRPSSLESGAEGRGGNAPDLAHREGYRADFLGNGGLKVQFPVIPTRLRQQLAPVSGRDDSELKYSHFSVFMRADRRLPFYTACNIDGNLLFNFPRGTDRWFMDARLANPDHQIGQSLYIGTPLDRGHLVRRLDPAWGNSRAEAKAAEEDTFFYTNCSPQHLRLNRRTWLSLEDYVLSNANNHDLKVCVFAGPVMDAVKDREYRGVKIPEEFWKVLVIVNAATKRLSATGYILSQADYLGDLEFVYGQYKTYQVPLKQIENKTELSFALSEFDPLGRVEARPQREIQGPGDLIL